MNELVERHRIFFSYLILLQVIIHKLLQLLYISYELKKSKRKFE
jgi:hypothetical protein